jgi:hypothetical protein
LLNRTRIGADKERLKKNGMRREEEEEEKRMKGPTYNLQSALPYSQIGYGPCLPTYLACGGGASMLELADMVARRFQKVPIPALRSVKLRHVQRLQKLN